MACNCKNKMKLVNSKYGDGNDNKNETILSEIFNFIIRFIFGILCGMIKANKCPHERRDGGRRRRCPPSSRKSCACTASASA